MGTRDELLEAVAARYLAATRTEKGRILTEFAEISGYHRKHAERLLRRGHVVDRSRPRPERRICDEAVREALVLLWEAGDRICGKRLKPLIPKFDTKSAKRLKLLWRDLPFCDYTPVVRLVWEDPGFRRAPIDLVLSWKARPPNALQPLLGGVEYGPADRGRCAGSQRAPLPSAACA